MTAGGNRVEKRKFERVDLRTEAVVRHRDVTFRGEVENLSLKGLFVRTDQKIPLHDKVDVAMFFHGSTSELSFSLEANVVRTTEEGIGLNFRKIDIDSLVRSDVAAAAGGDRQQVIEEFYGYARNNDAAEDEELNAPAAAS